MTTAEEAFARLDAIDKADDEYKLAADKTVYTYLAALAGKVEGAELVLALDGQHAAYRKLMGARTNNPNYVVPYARTLGLLDTQLAERTSTGAAR